jgi:hypothetical protein
MSTTTVGLSFLTLGEEQFMEEVKTAGKMLTLVVKGTEVVSRAVIPKMIQPMLGEF